MSQADAVAQRQARNDEKRKEICQVSTENNAQYFQSKSHFPQSSSKSSCQEHELLKDPITTESSEQIYQAQLSHRHPSVSFNDEVILDSGQVRAIEDPLPHNFLFHRSIDKSAVMQEEGYPARPSLIQGRSEADIYTYDATTGRRLDNPSYNLMPDSDDSMVKSPFSSTFATSTGRYASDLYERKSFTEAEDLAQTRDSRDAENITFNSSQHPVADNVSLTSDATLSPLTEAVTPPRESLTSELEASVVASPTSTNFPALPPSYALETSSTWPISHSTSGYAPGKLKSSLPERKPSLRQARRQSSRRSTTSSTSASPATAFLSRFSRDDSAQELDAEGQEIGDYVLGKQIGYGGFSVIKEAYSLRDDDTCQTTRSEGHVPPPSRLCRAVKIVRKQLISQDEAENDRLQQRFDREVELWRRLNHQNILPLLEVYETNFATFCFTKLNTGGTLFDRIKADRAGLGMTLTQIYARQLISAIDYLHNLNGIVHRDIKLENCLVDISETNSQSEAGNLLLCDFGLAEHRSNEDQIVSIDQPRRKHNRRQSPGGQQPQNADEASCPVSGSLQYASPEMLLSHTAFIHPAIDIWAFGIVVYALITGDLPFQHTFEPRTRMKILSGEWDMSKVARPKQTSGMEINDHCSAPDTEYEDLLVLISGCLDMRWKQRWTSKQVIEFQWLSPETRNT